MNDVTTCPIFASHPRLVRRPFQCSQQIHPYSHTLSTPGLTAKPSRTLVKICYTIYDSCNRTNTKGPAFVWELPLSRPSMKGSQFTACTNHSAYQGTLNLANVTRKPARCHLRLFEYIFDVFHRSGLKDWAFNALARLKTNGIKDSPDDNDIPILAM